MTTDEILDALRYKSEGTDLDFKQAQYRFAKASENDKAELLKDVVAIANAWRDGTGYILVGFKDSSPHPAEIVGITEHLDDASIQQFVHSKVKPNLDFRYEERIYEGKAVGIITIPKQKRPFYLANAYGALKSNVVYVRRGSSTDEAEPPEIAKMVAADVGRGNAKVELSILNAANESLPDEVALRFLKFETMPDYSNRNSDYPYGFSAPSLMRDNRDYWREVAEYLRTHLSLIGMQFALTNRSDFALSNAKLEISIHAEDGQEIKLMAGDDLPEEPQYEWNPAAGIRSFAEAMSRHGRFVIDEADVVPICHARFGTLLPGETARAIDFLAVLPSMPGRIRISIRVLAAELAVPIVHERFMQVTGSLEEHGFDGLQSLMAGVAQAGD